MRSESEGDWLTMPPSLPAITRDQRNLADVLVSAVAAVRGEENPFCLPPVSRAIVILVDGLGAANLAARRAHARTLDSLPTRSIASGFPTTTASALTSLMTGADPGLTGMVGYSIRDPESGTLINQLSGLDALDVRAWQPLPTVWESNPDVPAAIISSPKYRESGLTRAILRGADYVPARNDEERLSAVADVIRSHESGVAYVYIPELDMTAHGSGVGSDQWIRRLEELDGFVKDVLRVIGPRDGLILTADHGIIDVPASRHIDVPEELFEGTVIGGEPRFLHVYVDGDADGALARWRTLEGHRAHIVSRDEAITAGWFGDVAEFVRPRIGDILVTPYHDAVYYDPRTATAQSRAMVGQHGGLTHAEVQVPLVRGGRFA